MTALSDQFDYDPTSPLARADPYPCYARLRAHDPVHWDERLQVWMISRHSDVVGMLRDQKWSSNYLNGFVGRSEIKESQVRQPSGRVLLFMDAPEHTQLRRVLAKHLNPLVPLVSDYAAAVATQLLDSLRRLDEIDFISDFAAPLSLRVLARLLGIPNEDLAIVAESIQEISGLVDWTPSAQMLQGVEGRGAALTPYLLSLVERKRRDPGNDLLSALLMEAKNRKLRYLDVVSTAILLLAAGHVTSTHMLGNGVLALLRNRRILEECRSGRYPTLRLVDEVLRFDAPVQATPRTALAEMTLDGRTIRRGDVALGLLGSANRDSSVFSEPDRLDPGRRGGLVSFGGGAHHCVGADLGRATGMVAFDKLIGFCPRLRLSEQSLSWKPTITQRGLTALRIAL